ncbi:hypothetical protein HMPREF3038_02504 [Akkermansia sp. KLE1797]|nr:hypothetical protein HMPREF3038_02504 [Akkermansia sp. KLE1797]KXU52935.1 hypothetical protein HMPREF3039_02863 [Akkermansia sp. KLE1798]
MSEDYSGKAPFPPVPACLQSTLSPSRSCSGNPLSSCAMVNACLSIFSGILE